MLAHQSDDMVAGDVMIMSAELAHDPIQGGPAKREEVELIREDIKQGQLADRALRHIDVAGVEPFQHQIHGHGSRM